MIWKKICTAPDHDWSKRRQYLNWLKFLTALSTSNIKIFSSRRVVFVLINPQFLLNRRRPNIQIRVLSPSFSSLADARRMTGWLSWWTELTCQLNSYLPLNSKHSWGVAKHRSGFARRPTWLPNLDRLAPSQRPPAACHLPLPRLNFLPPTRNYKCHHPL